LAGAGGEHQGGDGYEQQAIIFHVIFLFQTIKELP
jgi:hypothetical protein